MAYDAESQRTVLFGGYHFGCRGDTWVYNLGANTWQNLSPSPAPPARCAFAMTYDSQSDRVILFGGDDLAHDLNDTWAYHLNTNTWTNMTPAVSPPGRVGGRLVYDSQLHQAILFGGHTMSSSVVEFNDTWTYTFSSNTWTQVRPTKSPPPHAGQVMAYDAESARVVLFGGQVGTGTSADDTWAYNPALNVWEQMAPGVRPPASAWDAAVYDARADRVVLFGGDDTGENQTWTYNYNADAWTKISTPSSPSDRVAHAMVYDAASDRTVLFGGMWPTGPMSEPALVKNRETWVFDRGNSSWTKVLGPLPPVASFSFSPAAPLPHDVVTFDASASSDPDGTVVVRLWNFGDGTTSYQESPTHSYATAGSKTVSLTVTDDDGLTNATTREVFIRETVLPTVQIISPTEGARLSAVTATVTGTASDNVGVAKVEVSLDNETWNLATGTTSWSVSLTLAEGTNTIYVRVTDTSGNTAASAIHVTVATPGAGGGIPVWIWFLVGLAAAGTAVAGYIMLRRRRKPTEAAPPH